MFSQASDFNARLIVSELATLAFGRSFKSIFNGTFVFISCGTFAKMQKNIRMMYECYAASLRGYFFSSRCVIFFF
ncbi:hypothetical protein EVA_15473 [gut metagenome]|uniref:Uncharacterized protein n=1 Tax=gut metagenome TaxID=749906 RepID=J9C945_9ZZZZ